MEEKKLDAAESLALIGRMIENTRNHMERNAGRPFLIWGYATVVFTLLISVVVFQTQDWRWNWLWFAMPAVAGAAMYLTHPAKTEGRVCTFVDRVIGQVWMVVGFSAFFIALISMLGVVRVPMLFLTVLMMGIGTAITSLVIRFTAGIAGGLIGIALAPLLLAEPANYQTGVFIAAFVVMMVVPGHILNYRSNHPKKQA